MQYEKVQIRLGILHVQVKGNILTKSFMQVFLRCYLVNEIDNYELLARVFVLFSLTYLHAGTRQEPYWVINVKTSYCRYLQALV